MSRYKAQKQRLSWLAHTALVRAGCSERGGERWAAGWVSKNLTTDRNSTAVSPFSWKVSRESSQVVLPGGAMAQRGYYLPSYATP